MSLPARIALARRSALHPAYLRPFRGLQQRRAFITVNFGTTRGGSRWLLILSGFLGGATVTVGGAYAFYHWSGLKTAVNTFRHPIKSYKQYLDAKKSSSETEIGADGAQMETSTQILFALRHLAKLYVAPIPGAEGLVDIAFNEIDKVVAAHQNEARAILMSAFNEAKDAVKARGDDSKAAAWDVLAILRVKLGQIQALTSAASQDKIGPLFERIPGFHEHASRHIPGIRDSLLPVKQRVLEKKNDVLSGLSRRFNASLPGINSSPSAVDGISTDNRSQQEPGQTGEHSTQPESPPSVP